MRRSRLDVAAIDAFLQAFDRDQGTTDESFDHADELGEARIAGRAGGALRWGSDPDDDPDDGRGGGWDRVGDAGVGAPQGPVVGCRRRLRIARRLDWGLRPGDLPPLVVLDGYVLDHRHHWRYAATGLRVPGARHRTLDRLWDFGRYDPVLVPQQTAAQAAELRWCAAVGEWDEVRLAGCTVPAWRVDVDDWDDRARYSLGMDAPELAADRLVEVADVARILGVAPSTVTSYLARGRLPAPQVRLAGRPAWSLPVLVATLTGRA
jgi:hypothetical protein